MKQKCQRCGKLNYDYDMLKLRDDDKVEDICIDCFNKEMAFLMEIEDFNDYDREYQVSDVDDVIHTFQIRKHIADIGVIWETNEIQDEEMKGYKFEVLADFDEEQEWAIRKLHYKVKKELSKKHIDNNYGKFNTIKDDYVKGRLEWGNPGPKLIVDGKTYTWEQLGDMLIGYAGYDFQLKLLNQIDSD